MLRYVLIFLGGICATLLIIFLLVATRIHSIGMWEARHDPQRDPYFLAQTCGDDKNFGGAALPAAVHPTNDDVVKWANQTIPHLVSFDFRDARGQLMAQKNNFTPEGWCGFVQALLESNILETTSQNKLTMSLTLDGPSHVIGAEKDKDIQVWHVEAPVTFGAVSSGAGGAPHPMRLTLRLNVTENTSKNNGKPLAISQFVMGPSIR